MNENKLKAYIIAEIWKNEKIDNKIVFHFSKEEAKDQFITEFDDYEEKEIQVEIASSYDKYIKGNSPYFLDPHKEENEHIFYEHKWHRGDEDAVCQSCERDTYESIPKSEIVCDNCHYCLECAIDHDKDDTDYSCDCDEYTKEDSK
ncbi:MAG: hypothetical protein JKY89_01260 [Immundisolibacteraceae bacterium]|nr:hypothetical protein [Immundisolibacteraceae bacterium]